MTVQDNGMEVETNYTCLAFQWGKATMAKTPPEEVDAESWWTSGGERKTKKEWNEGMIVVVE